MFEELESKENPGFIDDQSLLMLKLNELSEYSYNTKTIPIFPGASFNNNSNNSCQRQGRFNNLCVLNSNLPYAISNFLLGQEKEVSSVLKLTALQLSLLVPRIKIFKIIYNTNLQKELQIELPFENVTVKEDLEKIFTNSERQRISVLE